MDDDTLSLLDTEIYKCGEKLQRHSCHEVCYKYQTNNSKCHFEFPHEIIPESYFDNDTDSIFLKCLDSTINYYNPYILIYCRHNHDLRCISSGKAAKAGMFYITDYITKMEIRTYQFLSLLSRAVLRAKEMSTSDSTESAKNLLNKCLSQFIKQQQVHAQQAARYIRGLNDTIKSHPTAPMLSSLLLQFVSHTFTDETIDHNIHESINNEDKLESEHEDEHHIELFEPVKLHLSVDRSGRLIEANQIDNYYYRDSKLHGVCFYDFIWHFRVEKKSNIMLKDTDELRLGTYPRYELQYPHPQYQTHVLIDHSIKIGKDNSNLAIPRIIGMSVPRLGDKLHALFMLAHFKPFDVDSPLWNAKIGIENTYKQFKFSNRALEIMRNWDAIHECEDQCDADRLKKRVSHLQEATEITKSVMYSDSHNDTSVLLSTDKVDRRQLQKDIELNSVLYKLQTSNWFQSKESTSIVNTSNLSLPNISDSKIQQLKTEIKHEDEILQKKFSPSRTSNHCSYRSTLYRIFTIY